MTLFDIQPGHRFKSKGEAEFIYKVICVDSGRGASVHLKRETDGQLARLTSVRIIDMIREGWLVQI